METCLTRSNNRGNSDTVLHHTAKAVVSMPKIPKTIHYVFGMAADFGGKPWGLVHHACVMSAIHHIQPDNILFHYEFEPRGPWWELTKPYLTLMRRKAPTEIFGNPLLHVAHRAGVVRLQSLIEHGGIYLDADVLVHRSFDDILRFSTVLGREGEVGEFGMADAVILAEKSSPFLMRWLGEYQWFRSKGRDEYWAEHAVEVPGRLAEQHPSELHVLPYTAFFWPLWTTTHLEWIFRSTNPIPPGAYANHLWEARAWEYFEDLTPGEVRRVDSNFHRWIQPYIQELPSGFGKPSLSKRVYKQYRKTRSGIGIQVKRLLSRSM